MLNYQTAWHLSYYPATGNVLTTNTWQIVLRYDEHKVYFWDKRHKCEVSIDKSSLAQLLNMKPDNTAPLR